MGDEMAKDRPKVPPPRQPDEVLKGPIEGGKKSESTQNSGYWDWLGHGAGFPGLVLGVVSGVLGGVIFAGFAGMLLEAVFDRELLTAKLVLAFVGAILGAGMMYRVWKHVRVHGNRDPWDSRR